MDEKKELNSKKLGINMNFRCVKKPFLVVSVPIKTLSVLVELERRNKSNDRSICGILSLILDFPSYTSAFYMFVPPHAPAPAPHSTLF